MMNMDRFEKWEFETDAKAEKSKIANKRVATVKDIFGEGIAAQFGVRKKPIRNNITSINRNKAKTVPVEAKQSEKQAVVKPKQIVVAKNNIKQVAKQKVVLKKRISDDKNKDGNKRSKTDDETKTLEYANPDYNSERHARTNAWVEKHYRLQEVSISEACVKQARHPQPSTASDSAEPKKVAKKRTKSNSNSTPVKTKQTDATAIKESTKKLESTKNVESTKNTGSQQDSNVENAAIKQEVAEQLPKKAKKIRPVVYIPSLINTFTQTDLTVLPRRVTVKQESEMMTGTMFKVDLGHDQFANRPQKTLHNAKGNELTTWINANVTEYNIHTDTEVEKYLISMSSRFQALQKLDMSKITFIPDTRTDDVVPIRVYTTLSVEHYKDNSAITVPEIIVTRMYKQK